MILFYPTSGNSPFIIPLNGTLKLMFSNNHLVSSQHLRLIYEQVQFKHCIIIVVSNLKAPVGRSPSIQSMSSRFLCWKCRMYGCRELRRCRNITA